MRTVTEHSPPPTLLARSGMRIVFAGHRVPVGLLVIASLASAFAEAAVLALVAAAAAAMASHSHHLADQLSPLGLNISIGTALMLAGTFAVARLLLQLIVAWAPARIASGLQARLRVDLFDAFTHASWAVQSQEDEGHLQELMSNQVNQAMVAVVQVASALSGTLMFIVLVGTAFALNPLVALIVLATAFVLFWAVRPLVSYGRRASRDASNTTLHYAGGVSEAVRLAEEAQVFSAGSAQRLLVNRLIHNAAHAFFRVQLAGRLMATTYQSLGILLIVGGLATLYATGASKLAALGAIILMLVRASTYASQSQTGYGALNQVLPYLESIQSAGHRYRQSARPSGRKHLSHVRLLSFEEVCFSYRSESPVLDRLSFTIRFGEAIGIVGPSGAGKSTLVQLLLGLRDPTCGCYLVNEKQVHSYRLEDWRHRVAYVPQEPRIFHASVADNIRFFRNLDFAHVERAAKLAHIHADILRLPSGYDTVIGQVADAISGGQRQRICLARALAGEPELLILDEPTSQLDAESEAAIGASLMELRGDLTLIIVAHRMSTTMMCDRIMVLSRGQIEAFAPPSELQLTNAFYRTATASTLHVA